MWLLRDIGRASSNGRDVMVAEARGDGTGKGKWH